MVDANGYLPAAAAGWRARLAGHARDALAAGVTAAGVIVLLLGLAVLAGWYAGLPALVQIAPAFVPMQFNTALGFVLCGAALLVLQGGRTAVAAILGVAAGVLGLLTLAEMVSDLFFRTALDWQHGK